jgi:hypothetical protein
MSVYFATCRETGTVKIGHSVDPWSRLPELQLACPLPITIEAILPGGREEELGFHRRFEDQRIRGEWFTICEMIELVIAANPAPPKPEKAARQPALKKPKLEKKAAPRSDFNRSASYFRVGGTPPLGSNPRIDEIRYREALKEMRAAQAGAA